MGIDKRITCRERDSFPRSQPVKSANVIIRRWCIFLSVTSSNRQTFGTDWILKTVKPVKISQKLLTHVRIHQKNRYDSHHCFEPRRHAYVRGTRCLDRRYSLFLEKMCSPFRGIFSVFDTRITSPARINIEKDTYVSNDNLSDLS